MTVKALPVVGETAAIPAPTILGVMGAGTKIVLVAGPTVKVPLL